MNRLNNFYYMFRKIFFFIIISFYLFFIVLIPSNLITGLVSNAQNPESNNEVETLTDKDIQTLGVQWSYQRPDNGPKGNSTCWKLRWSPDGEFIAVVYFDNTIVILDSITGNPIRALGTAADKVMGNNNNEPKSRCFGYTANPKVPLLRVCEWSPNGKFLAVAGDHKLIEIYNTTTWQQTIVLEGHFGSVLSLAWSPDGTKLASGEGTDQVLYHNEDDCKNVIKLWNMPSGKEMKTLWGHEDGIMSLSWANDNIRLVSASDDSNLKIWNTSNGSVIYTLGEGVGHFGGVLDVDWSPNQTLLASGSRDFKVRFWDVINGTPFGKPLDNDNCQRSVHWHPSGRYILSAGVDQVIKIRNATNRKEMNVFDEASGTNSEVMSARWSPDGLKFVACSTVEATVRLYALGFEEDDSSESTVVWTEGIPIFFVIAIIGLFLLYYSLRNELREHRK